MELLIVLIYGLPFLLSSHYCLSAALHVNRSRKSLDASLSDSNSSLLKTFLVCVGATSFMQFITVIGGWVADFEFGFYTEIRPWAVSALGWCVVWHGYKFDKSFCYKIPGPTYKVELNSDNELTKVEVRGK